MTMHKVIIVEDDRIIRRSLCQAPWEQHGFIVAGEASNGETAVELISKEQPQVVVSDINMPFMNGLEMAKTVKKTSPQTRIIFLTGYEDFNYAKQAVKLQAYDYLLKPVNVDELIDKASDAAAEWTLEMRKEKKFEDSLPLLQQQFLQKLTQEEAETKGMDVETELLDLGIELLGPFYTVLLIHAKESQTEKESELKQVLQHLDSPLLGDINGQLINGEANEVALFLSLDEECENQKEQIANNLLQYVKNKIDTSVTITIGRTYSNIFEIGTAYIESKLAMDMRHIMGTDHVYSIDDTVSSNFNEENTFEELENKLEKYIKKGLPKKAHEKLEQIHTAFITNKNIPLQDTRLFALKFSTLLSYEIKKWKQNEGDLTSIVHSYEQIIEFQSLKELMDHLHTLIAEWTEVMTQTADKNHQTIVDKAISFMNEHYADPALTQQKVASSIYVSAPYLSNLFKIEKGVNFTTYLLEVRMKKAMELLRQSDAKAYQVAEAIGYTNPQYFSISFKKYTGYTPSQFGKRT